MAVRTMLNSETIFSFRAGPLAVKAVCLRKRAGLIKVVLHLPTKEAADEHGVLVCSPTLTLGYFAARKCGPSISRSLTTNESRPI